MTMDVFTGYYAQMKKYRAADLVPVSIAFVTPVWYEGETCFDVAPPHKLISEYKAGRLSVEEYSKQYIQYLDNNVKWGKVMKKLKEISAKNDNKDLVLCCYEKPEDFCHRHLLAKYLNENIDEVDCIEWKVK